MAKLIEVWSELTLPLRPRDPVPTKVKALIDDPDSHILILGVTPEYSQLTTNVTALDHAVEMIEGVWPGDTDHRRAVLGSWLDMPFEDSAFDVVITDNGFSFMPFPNDANRVLSEVKRVLKPRGKVIVRWTIAPDIAMTDAEIVEYALQKCDGKMEALRWQFAVQASARSDGNSVVVKEAYALFERLFPDTRELLVANGWNAETFARMAFYKGGGMQLNFPTKAELSHVLEQHFDDVAFVDSGKYPMSELEPLVVLQA